MSERPVRHLNQAELARRWSVSPRTLEAWRCRGRGPCFLKIVGRIVYRLEDIEAFEAEQRREAGRHDLRSPIRPQPANGRIGGRDLTGFSLVRRAPSHGVANGFANRYG